MANRKTISEHEHSSERLNRLCKMKKFTDNFLRSRFCKKYYAQTRNPQLKAATSEVLIDSGSLSYRQQQTLIKYNDWWTRSNVVLFLREDIIGKPSYETLINGLLRDEVADVAMVASDMSIKYGLSIHRHSTSVHKLAQMSLKKAGIIGRIAANDCFIRDSVRNILGSKLGVVDWKTVLGKRYREVLARFVRWDGYVQTDPTAWVNITDTINDTLLDILFPHDGRIGKYRQGCIGSVLTARSKFAKKYPRLFVAVKDIHDKRLESDLSHAKVRSTGKLTRYITFKDMNPLIKKLSSGYYELWRLW